MKANKIFFDLFSTSGGMMPYEEYRKWYDKNDIVYICLLDVGIYTKVHREEMFKKNMNCGCFIEHCPCRTPEEVTKEALDFITINQLFYTTPDEFIAAEKEAEEERVKKAFSYAENLIAND